MTIYTAAITLILLMDPLGNVPIFLSVLNKTAPEKRRRIVIREMLIALLILLVFLYFGQYIMTGMGVTGPALNIAGGVILFLVAIRMIFPGNQLAHSQEDEDDPFIVPLAVPLIAGPSAMAVIILFATREPDRMMDWTLALVIAWASTGIILLLSEHLRRILKERGLRAVARLMGMILTTMAIQMMLNGYGEFIKGQP